MFFALNYNWIIQLLSGSAKLNFCRFVRIDASGREYKGAPASKNHKGGDPVLPVSIIEPV